MDSENISSTKQLMLLRTRENQSVIFIVIISTIISNAKQNKMQQTRKKEKKKYVDIRVAEGERDMHGEVSQE